MKAWIIGLSLQSSLHAWIECNIANVETDFRRELREVRVPALVIHGDADVSAPIELTGRRTAQLIAGCRFELYPGAPHGFFVTHREQLNRDLLEFIRG
jgi:pimeloyl-ACP methyl ester carboxylesterase